MWATAATAVILSTFPLARITRRCCRPCVCVNDEASSKALYPERAKSLPQRDTLKKTRPYGRWSRHQATVCPQLVRQEDNLSQPDDVDPYDPPRGKDRILCQ